MNVDWFYALVLAFVCVGGPLMYARARRLDRADDARAASYASKSPRPWADIREWHLLHGPTDGCIECRDK